MEDSDSEDESLELSEDEATGAKGGWGLTGAGWWSVAAGAERTGLLSGSSGIFAKRISKTSCKRQ